MNPRRSAREMRDPQHWHGLLRRMEQAIAETRSLGRTLGSQHAHRETWGSAFADPWIGMLGDAGRGARDADPVALLAVRRRLEDFTEELRSTERSAEWPIYGALIINLRNILDAMGEVAKANPIRGAGDLDLDPGAGRMVGSADDTGSRHERSDDADDR